MGAIMGEGKSVSLARVVGVTAVAWLALWACAPTSVVAPMVPLNQEEGWDLGFAASGGALVTTEIVDVADDTGTAPTLEPAAGGQVWAVKDLGRVDLGGTLGGMGTHGEGGPHAGVMFRPHLVENEKLVVGLDLQLGFLWGSVGVPVSVRASDRVWIYTDPSLGVRYTGLLHVPAGLSVEVAEHARVNAELEFLSGDMGYIDGPVVLGSVGVSYRP